MDNSELMYLLPYIISFLISVGIGFYAFGRRRVDGAFEFSVLAFLEAFSILFYIFEMLSVSLAGKVFWDNLQWPLYLGWGLWSLVFCIRYSRFGRVWERNWFWLLALPGAVYSAAVFVPAAFALLQPNAVLVQGALYQELTYDFSLTALVVSSFYLLMVFTGLGVLIFRYFYRTRLFQMRLGVVTLGILVPSAGTILALADIRVLDFYRDLFPFTTAASNIIIAWAMFRLDLFRLVPVAYETILESLEDMIVVLDERYRVVYVNQVAEQVLAKPEPELIGKVFFGEVLAENQEEFGEEISLGEGEEQRWFSVSLNPITNRRGREVGQVVLLHDITPRVRDEERLRDVQVNLSQAQVIANLGSWEYDLAKDEFFWSDHIYRILGSAPGAIPSTIENFTEYIHPEDRERFTQAIQSAMDSQYEFDMEFRIRWEDGTERYVHAQAAVLRDQQDALVKLFGTLQDISDRKQVEDQLKLQSRMLEVASNGMVITDKDGHIVWANPAITTLTGYEVEELVGQKPSVFKSGKQPEEAYKELWDTILAGKVWRGQIINKRKDGSLYHEELTITPYLNKAGEVTHHIAIKRDVTARVEALYALRKSEETFRALFERTNDAVFIIDMDLNHIAVNQQAADMLGYTIEELEKMKTSDIVAPEEWDESEQRAQQLRDGEIPPIYERTMVHKDGHLINVELSVAPVMDENGQLSHIQSIVRDITARKQQEAELQRMALYDHLTGLPNRVLLFERFEMAVEHAKRNRVGIALLFIDLDNFKAVNDSYGHDVGDETLKLAAQRMQEALRKSDTVARLSGDEFAIMMEGVGQKGECAMMADRVIAAIHGIKSVDGHPVKLGASVGISVFPHDGETFDELLAAADRRMYKVKHGKKDGYLLE